MNQINSSNFSNVQKESILENIISSGVSMATGAVLGYIAGKNSERKKNELFNAQMVLLAEKQAKQIDMVAKENRSLRERLFGKKEG